MITLDLPHRSAPRDDDRPKRRAVYHGATSNRLTADWIASILSADRETRGALRTLRARSRQLCRDNAHASGMLTAMEDNVCGPEGIGINPRMRLPRGKLLKPENDAAWQAFQDWGAADTCSADGQNSWAEMQRLVLRTWLMDGEAIVRRLPGFDNAFGYALQILDADLLDETYDVAGSDRRNQITQGIEIDRWGRPVAYWLWNRHPSDTYGGPLERTRVPADEIMHLFTQLRNNQRRGIPILTPALISLKMVDGYTEAEVTQARIAATQGGFFTAKGEDAAIAAQNYEGETDEPLEFEREPGVDRQLPPGWGYEQVDPTHPNGNFTGFQKAMLRVISRAVGVSYITLSGDLSDTSYSSGRVGLDAERDHFRRIQKWLGTRLVIPVYRDVIRYGAIAGIVSLPRGTNVRWDACDLEPRGWRWIDPKSDANATDMRLKNKLTSPQRVCAAEGVDIEDVLDEWKEFTDMLEARGLEMPAFGDTAAAVDEPDAPPAQTTPDPTQAGVVPFPVRRVARHLERMEATR